MSDTTGSTPADGTPDSTPTEALHLADQQPLAAEPPVYAPQATAAAPQAAGGNHPRTILEVIGGVVAAGLIVAAGAVGFAVGHATGGDDGRWSMTSDSRGSLDGPDAGAPMGPGQGFGRDGDRDSDRDGGRGMMPGQGQGQGFDPRGIDPDGDNWTGQNGMGPGMPGQPGPGLGQELPDDDAVTPQG
jgi:hypothetical protein